MKKTTLKLDYSVMKTRNLSVSLSNLYPVLEQGILKKVVGFLS